MSDPNRQGWLKGDPPKKEDDEFARHAARGREELGSEAEARELMSELDGMFAARFGETQAKTDFSVSAKEESGEHAGAKEVPLEGRTKTKVRRLGRYYAAAAAILLLVAAGSWWITQQNTLSPENLYAEAFSPYANDLSGRTMGSNEPTTSSALDEASLAYDRRDYVAAADGFGRYLTALPTPTEPASAPPSPGEEVSKPKTEKIRLYYGISLLAANQPEAAMAELEALINDPATGPPAAWYRALAQVRLGRLAEARQALAAIANDENSAFSSKAKGLLRSIPSDL